MLWKHWGLKTCDKCHKRKVYGPLGMYGEPLRDCDGCEAAAYETEQQTDTTNEPSQLDEDNLIYEQHR